jgi:hypothetical protein
MDGGEERILIRVLPGGLFPQDRTRDLRDDVPLETVANRSAPMGCGPNVDQAGPLSGPLRLGQWAAESG